MLTSNRMEGGPAVKERLIRREANFSSLILLCPSKQGRKDYKDILATLKKEHPKWKLPDRRVKKFVKRQKAGTPMIEDDESVASSVGPLRRYLSNRRTKKTGTTAPAPKAPAEQEKQSQMPPMEKEPEEEPDLLKDIPTPAEYVDDNKDKKESGLCVCTGCTVM
mmetsp:Transcript_35271/g.73432  ORF Transcript_35271/g.73432 Transcript_35271/m.73432 type:complete len:164 (-) Transcript_35271:574-1065(-)